MKLRLGIFFFALVIGVSAFGFRASHLASPDLSTPQKSFSAFVEILKTGNVEALPTVATRTGQISLGALYSMQDFQDGMSDLGDELANSKPEWSEITEDIFFASVKVGKNAHKMEFTKEEPGWMLYHWQIGGGADHLGAPSEDTED